MYKFRYRKESFGYIVSHSNGWVEFYDDQSKSFLQNHELKGIDSHKLGDGKNILSLKKQGISCRSWYDFPKEIFESSCPLKAPIVVQLELTLKCNLKCDFCFNYAQKPRKNELSLSEIKDILTTLKRMDVMSVFFTGGEATLNSDFVEILNFAEQLDLDFFVLTNGTRINEKLLDVIPKQTYFVISFDGIQSHQVTHGGLDFEGLQKLFKLLKKKGFPFTTQYVLQRKNVEDLIATYKWCGDNKIDLAAIDLYMTGRARLNPDIFPTRDQLPLFRQLAMAKFEYEKIQSEWEKEQSYQNAPNPYHFTFIARLEEIFERSFSGVFFAYITSNGYVYPDNWHGGEGLFCAGSIREKSFEEIWNTSFADIRQLGQWKNWDHCTTCPVSKSFCDYRLPVLSRNIHGNYNICGATEFQKEVMLMRANIRNTEDFALSNDFARAIDIW